MIENPKRKVIVNFSIDQVKDGVKNLTLVNSKYKLQEENDIISMYQFHALEFLSLGIFADINLSEVSENKTEILIEIRRAIGSFDKSYEVSQAGGHLNKILEGISKTLENPNLISELKEKEVVKAKKLEEDLKKTPTGLIAFVMIAFIFLTGVIYVVNSSDDEEVIKQPSATEIVEQPKEFFVNKSTINMRLRPNTKSRIVTTLKKNTVVTVIPYEEINKPDWYWVEVKDTGEVGFIYHSLLTSINVDHRIEQELNKIQKSLTSN